VDFVKRAKIAPRTSKAKEPAPLPPSEPLAEETMSTNEATPPAPSAPPALPAAAPVATPATVSKSAQAEALIKNKVLWSLGAGLVPLPVIDLAAIAAVQVKLVNELSDLYGVEFSAEKGKKTVAVLTASVGTGVLATGVVASFLKIVPGLGMAAGAVALPVVAGASTYALGRVFVQHYESGGSLIDLDQEKAKACFLKAYEDGKKFVVKLKDEVTGKA